MKKLILLILFPLGMAGQSFQKNQKDLNVGLGLVDLYLGSGYSSHWTPLFTSFDYGITDDISIGAAFEFSSATWKYSGSDFCNSGNGVGNWYTYTDTYRNSYFVLGARAAWHFARFVKVDKLDLYAGIMLGNVFYKQSYSTTSPCPKHYNAYTQTAGGALFSLYGGARYRFNDNFGLFMEAGYGYSLLTIGANFKF